MGACKMDSEHFAEVMISGVALVAFFTFAFYAFGTLIGTAVIVASLIISELLKV